MKHNYFCRFLFLTIFFLGMQASLKGGTSNTSAGTTLSTNKSYPGKYTLTEGVFVYNVNTTPITGERTPGNTNHNFSAIAEIFDIDIRTPEIVLITFFQNMETELRFLC